ncbi:MAG TPA: hypothetical protein VN851_00585 [Thermoanaerobaculia bacterium]|nr:hypothetical protein [Thermoanaerobaculia bacterium]
MISIDTNRRTPPSAAWLGAALLGALLTIGLGACNSTSTPSGSPLADSAFQVEWLSAEVPAQMKPNEVATVKVKFRNISDQVWPDPKTAEPAASGAYAVRLAWRWRTSEDMTTGEGTGVRADLVEPLGPGRETTLSIDVTAPKQPGQYRLQFDLVQELVAFFEDRGAKLEIVPVSVQ